MIFSVAYAPAKIIVRDRTGITFTVLEGKIDSSLDDFSSQVSMDTSFGKIVKI